MPDFSLQYFIGSNAYEGAENYHGFEVGVALPLFFHAQKARIKAARLTHDASLQQGAYLSEALKTKQQELRNTQLQVKAQIEYYQKEGLNLYQELLRSAQVGFENGELDYYQWTASTETALQLQLDYLDQLLHYNSLTLELNYLNK